MPVRRPISAMRGLEDVDVEIGALALHDGGDALEAHAGVDVLLRERLELAAVLALELREDEVPDLDEAVAVAGGGAIGLAAADVGAVVEEYLAAGAAGAVGAVLDGVGGPVSCPWLPKR